MGTVVVSYLDALGQLGSREPENFATVKDDMRFKLKISTFVSEEVLFRSMFYVRLSFRSLRNRAP